MLERQGLVVNNPRRGTYVTRLSQADALDLGYTRALLESFAVTVGLPQLNQSVFAVLEEHLDAMGTCNLPDDLPRLVQIDLAFHRVLVECSRSTRLMELWSSLNGQIGALFIRGIEHQHAHTPDIVALHQQLIDALRSSEPQTIQRSVLEHYVRVPRPNAMQHEAMLNTLQTIATNYVSGSEE
jgi:DNA-binding GntR family transcriptional regulator